MKRFPLSMLVSVLIILLSVMFVTAKVAQAASTWGENWRIVKSPNMGSNNNTVTDLAAISTNDVWATGNFTIPGTHTTNGLIEHCDGSRWSLVSRIRICGEQNIEEPRRNLELLAFKKFSNGRICLWIGQFSSGL